MILTWQDRCEIHPDHQSGMITHGMIKERMQEEIDDLREQNAILCEALERIVKLKDNQSISYEKWELMVEVAVEALQRAGGGK